MKKATLILILLFSAFLSFSENKSDEISIRVVDSQGELLTGAAISDQDGQLIGFTDLNGVLRLNQNQLQTLDFVQIEFVSYKPLKLTIEQIQVKTVVHLQSL